MNVFSHSLQHFLYPSSWETANFAIRKQKQAKTMKLKKLLVMLLGVLPMTTAMGQVAHFDMSLSDGKITESVSKAAYAVNSQLPACTIAGLDGDALRFDGYSNYVRAALPATLSTTSLTIQVVLAAETYPMMVEDVAETTPTYATICGNLDETAKKGFALELSSQGDLRFRFASTYASGTVLAAASSEKLDRGVWNIITIVANKADNKVYLYVNGVNKGERRMSNGELVHNTGDFYIGKNQENVTDKWINKMLLNTFCGLIDDIAIYNEVKTPEAFTSQVAHFNYPASRYAESLWRPQFHGMPSGGWSNETHGMTLSNGKYHVFFQKNANGPYMSRLHWGHISSENLYDWREEPIAIYPGESFDIKGCWSGCVYEDGANTYILYTAVDNAKARIVQAKAKDASLIEWGDKTIIIDGAPSGLSADFRDPYYFEANGNKYIIVGTSKNNLGACTLHKWNGSAWSNDGTLFFQGANASQHGTFWEMPNVTPMGDGKFLFTCTPLGTSVGVRTLCWVGTIGTDGKFTPDGNGVQYLEMGGISRDGYGLLSPTIYQKDGKTLMLGIVPDKLATEENFKMGWAHNYSLPRELSLDASGKLIQKPYSGLTAMRTTTTASVDESLLGTKALVSGRQIELLGEFTPTTGTCGFRFLKDATLTYDADTRSLTLDISALQRTSNDGGVYNGVYTTTVPETLKKLHVFLDGSILDIFVNDKWAYSVRVFPTDASATSAQVFATAETAVKVSAWTLNATKSDPTGISEKRIVKSEKFAAAIYDLQGRKIGSGLKRGLYIKNGKKYVAR